MGTCFNPAALLLLTSFSSIVVCSMFYFFLQVSVEEINKRKSFINYIKRKLKCIIK